MNRYIIAAWMTAVIFMLSSPNRGFAQAVANAQIHGVVSDATGAVVPGAAVKTTQTDTGQVRTAVTANDGSYVLPNLPVGPYTLEVTIPQFNSYVQSGIILQVGTNVGSTWPLM
jgi:Carboxypeptidase regulatory-like domain